MPAVQVAPSFVDLACTACSPWLAPDPQRWLPGGLAATQRFENGTVRKSPPDGVLGGPAAQSVRLSCQTACSRPLSASMSGKNWCPTPCGSIRAGADHVAPPFVVLMK